MTEQTQEPLDLPTIDGILRKLVPMSIKTKAVVEYCFSEIHRMGDVLAAVGETIDELSHIHDLELRLTELESRVDVIASRVKGEAG